MDRARVLRVLIAGQRNTFHHVLATCIRRCGYEVVELTPEMMMGVEELEGDVLLYDIDEPQRVARLIHWQDMTWPLYYRENYWPKVQFIIALSCESVSRAELEGLGAIALLQKATAVNHLPRYLRVLQQLLNAERRPVACERAERLRVLVVDDQTDITNTVGEFLQEEAGYEVQVASNGLDALECWVAWRPHCIVTDLLMPLTNGYQVIRCLDSSAVSTMPAFVVMSALPQLDVPVKRPYLEGKVVMYVDKPFRLERLLTAVEQALHGGMVGTGPLA